jgi:hypothetical protein
MLNCFHNTCGYLVIQLKLLYFYNFLCHRAINFLTFYKLITVKLMISCLHPGFQSVLARGYPIKLFI